MGKTKVKDMGRHRLKGKGKEKEREREKGKGKGKEKEKEKERERDKKIVLPPHAFYPSQWISMKSPKLHPYFPQIEDRVAILRKGYEKWRQHALKLVHSNVRTKIQSESLPENSRPVEFYQITELRFHIGPPTFCTVTLHSLENGIEIEEETTEFELSFQDIDSVSDFMILKSRFDASCQKNFQVGQRVSVTYPEAIFRGVISECKKTDDPWEKFLISWDGGGKPEWISSWELEHEGSRNTQSLEEDEEINLRDVKRIAAAINGAIKMPEAQFLVHEVDYTSFSDYCMVIPYPICLNTILDRLGNGFYRRKAAIRWELNLLKWNVETYNEPKSLIVLNAEKVIASILQSLDLEKRPIKLKVGLKKTSNA